MYIVELIHSHFHRTPKVINLCHEIALKDLPHALFCVTIYGEGDFDGEKLWLVRKLRNAYLIMKVCIRRNFDFLLV